jgi:hypothetical protein
MIKKFEPQFFFSHVVGQFCQNLIKTQCSLFVKKPNDQKEGFFLNIKFISFLKKTFDVAQVVIIHKMI